MEGKKETSIKKTTQQGYHSELKKEQKNFSDKQKLKEFINTKPTEQEVLKGPVNGKEKATK